MPQERPRGKEMEVVLIVVVTVHFVDATPKATEKNSIWVSFSTKYYCINHETLADGTMHRFNGYYLYWR